MNTKRQANFSLSIHVLNTLKENVAPRKQSEFVETAIGRQLKNMSFKAALKTSAGAWKKKGHKRNTERFIRSLRESSRHETNPL